MKRIMLVCSTGMSTSLLVKKMKEAAVEQKVEVEIFAVAQSDMKNQKNVDIILLGPQVRFLLNEIKPKMDKKGIPVAVIDSVDYGTMNGKKVLEKTLKLMN